MFAKTKLAAVAWAALTLGVAAAADDAIQTLHAGAVTYEVPKTWHSERPSSPMRKAQIKVDPVAGDAEPAGRQAAQTLPPAGTEKARCGPGAPQRAHSASAGA